jgi:hypothetical protein
MRTEIGGRRSTWPARWTKLTQLPRRKLGTQETEKMSAIEILKNLKALVGDVVFKAAVEAVLGDTAVVASSPAQEPIKKERKKRVVSDETAQKVRDNMARMQLFMKHVRTEMDPATPYKEVQSAAGARWKAMSDEEKDAWVQAHAAAPEAAPAASLNASLNASLTTDDKAEKTVVITGAAEKKPRGRPPKVAASE